CKITAGCVVWMDRSPEGADRRPYPLPGGIFSGRITDSRLAVQNSLYNFVLHSLGTMLYNMDTRERLCPGHKKGAVLWLPGVSAIPFSSWRCIWFSTYRFSPCWNAALCPP